MAQTEKYITLIFDSQLFWREKLGSVGISFYQSFANADVPAACPRYPEISWMRGQAAPRRGYGANVNRPYIYSTNNAASPTHPVPACTPTETETDST